MHLYKLSMVCDNFHFIELSTTRLHQTVKINHRNQLSTTPCMLIRQSVKQRHKQRRTLLMAICMVISTSSPSERDPLWGTSRPIVSTVPSTGADVTACPCVCPSVTDVSHATSPSMQMPPQATRKKHWLGIQISYKISTM